MSLSETVSQAMTQTAVSFEPNEGFKLSFERKSILFQMAMLTKPGSQLAHAERVDFARATEKYLADISGRPPPSGRGLVRGLRTDDFRSVMGVAYKVVTPQAEEYLRKGSFRLGSPTYYARLGDDPGADVWEGYSTIYVDTADRTFGSIVTTGFNCLAFCTTRAKDRTRLEQLRRKFGGEDGRIIRIDDVVGLAGALSKAVACSYHDVKDVIYRDVKFSHIRSDQYMGIIEIMKNSPPYFDLDGRDIKDIAEQIAPLLHRDALNSSLFAKHTRYAHEQERRLLFEFAEDVAAPYHIDVVVPDALKFLDFSVR